MININKAGVNFILLMLFLILLCCSNPLSYQLSKNKYPHVFKSIKLSSNMPVVLSDGNLENEIDSAILIYYDNFIMFKSPHANETFINVADHTGQLTSHKLIQIEIKYDYFIYKKGDSIGFKYDSLNAKTGHKLLVDSFLYKKGYLESKLYNNMYNNTTDSLVGSFRADNDVLIEKFVTKNKYDETYNDTTYLYYSAKLNNVEFAISKQLDSVKRMKLYKSRFIFNATISDKYLFPLPSRELWFKLEEIPTTNEQEITSIIQKFKSDIN